MNIQIFTRSFLIMVMSLNYGLGSELMSPNENSKMEHNIFQKFQSNNNMESILSEQEKEWVYETKLLNSLKDLEKQTYSNFEDLDRLLGQIAEFYEYKGKKDLAEKRYYELAKKQLNRALKGSEDDIGYFNTLMQQGLLNDEFFKNLISQFQNNSTNFSNNKFNENKNELKKHIYSLVKAYQGTTQKAWKKRKEYEQPIIPIYDELIDLELKNRLLKNTK